MLKVEQTSYSEQAIHLVRDLHTPNRRIYWTDLLATGAVAWMSLTGLIFFRVWSTPALAAFALCVLAFYRGLCFLHELTHVRKAALPGFETGWNLLFGVPILLPSFMYVGVHSSHHSTVTYGTDDDPEYLPFSGKPVMIVIFILQGFLLPALLVIRAFVLAPASLVVPPLRRWVGAHASALSMNVKYKRGISDGTDRIMRRWELMTIVCWALLSAGFAYLHVLTRFFAVWYTVVAVVAVVNTVRTLGAHRYSSDGQPRDREAQLVDSIDTPGALWTELWAPVGLRFHALHHYFPGIPYHNLKIAHQRLMAGLPASAPYYQTLSRSLAYSLGRLGRGR